MHRLFVTDLDHTFLRSDLSLSTFSKEIWNTYAIKTNLSIATARSFYSATSILKDITLKQPMILLDGALIATKERHIIDAKFINQDIANALIEEAIKFDNLHPFVIALKDNKLNESFDFPKTVCKTQASLLSNYKNDPRLVEHEYVYATDKTFKVVYMATKERLIPLTTHLKELFGEYFEFKLSPENYSGDYFLTILHPDGDKAHALQLLSQHLNLSLEHTTVFGDSINDIGMFKLAAESLAVNNALDVLKEHASEILARSNDEDAVAHHLKRANTHCL